MGFNFNLQDLLLAFTGGSEWGENPHDNPPTGRLQHYPAFRPDHIAVLYLGLYPNWTVRVNHASYAMPGADPAARLAKAASVLNDIVISANPNARFRDFQATQNPYQRADNQQYDSVNFDLFRFWHQNEIFVYLHQAGLQANQITGITLDPKLLVSFGSRLQKTDANGNHLPAEMNYSFFNTRTEPTGVATVDQAGKLIRIENFTTQEYGNPIDAVDQSYSMNIHFTIPGNDGISIPMVFDPDTGNGTGNEP